VVSRALFGNRRTDWETPPELFERLDREFRFTLDVCATRANRKCTAYFSNERNGLRQAWSGRCWMNPPYGRAIGRWIAKALQESRKALVVALLPARTDTAWWQDGVMRAREIRLLRGRLRFVGAKAPAPFPSAIAVFTQHKQTASPCVRAWDWRATILNPAHTRRSTRIQKAAGRYKPAA
jgi:phage N-6-adenine-methyltransferase